MKAPATHKGLEHWPPDSEHHEMLINSEGIRAVLLREKSGRFRLEVSRRGTLFEPHVVEHAPNADRARAKAVEILTS